MWKPGHFPAVPLPIQFPAYGLEEQWRMASGPCPHMGDLEEAKNSTLQISLPLAVAVTWGMTQWIEDVCLSFSLEIFLGIYIVLCLSF